MLIFAMRMMGKRQIGELEISDLVTTLLISEIASLPITDNSIPLSHAVVPVIILLTFEVVSSALLAEHPRLKNILSARPATLIQNGKLRGREMKNARISTDELISELRQKDITDISQVAYAILEQNGKITVIPKAKYRSPSADDLQLSVEDDGLYHIIIDKGVINRHNLQELNMTDQDLKKELSHMKLSPKEIYLLMISDTGQIKIIRKNEV